MGWGQDLISNAISGSTYDDQLTRAPKATAELVQSRRASSAEWSSMDLLRLSKHQSKPSLRTWVENPIFLDLDRTALMNALTDAPENIEFSIPVATGKEIVLDLTRIKVVSEDFTVRTASGRKSISGPTGLFYTGIVSGDLQSVVTLSLFADDIRILIIDRGSSYVLGRLQDDSGQYVLYNEARLLQEEQAWECFTKDSPLPDHKRAQMGAAPSAMEGGGCVKVYVETEFQVYQDLGNSLLAVTNYILGIFAESIVAYRNIEVNMEVIELVVWDVQDPYSDEMDEDDPVTVRDAFVDNTPTFNGDLAHLITTRRIGGGIALGIGGICDLGSDPGPYCLSGRLSASFDVSTLPSTSSTFVRVAHEMGHVLGARHTQACVWGPAGDEQIDDCGNTWVLINGRDDDGDCPGDTNTDGCECCTGDFNVDETDEANAAEGAACFDPNNPVVPTTANGFGTIMSYCHLNGTNRDIDNGFHEEVAEVINDVFLTSDCLTDEDCACEEFADRTVNGAPIGNGIYGARNTITSMGDANGPAPQVVVFQAGERITLESGFEATELFIAEIVPGNCDDDGSGFNLATTVDVVDDFPQLGATNQVFEGEYLQVYPSPTSDVLTIVLQMSENEPVKLRVVNQMGQTVYELAPSISEGQTFFRTTVPVQNWPDGLYYVISQSDTKTLTYPIVKQ